MTRTPRSLLTTEYQPYSFFFRHFIRANFNAEGEKKRDSAAMYRVRGVKLRSLRAPDPRVNIPRVQVA